MPADPSHGAAGRVDEANELIVEHGAPVYESAGWHVSDFARTFCRHTKGRWARQQLPMELEEWQDEFVDEAFLLDADGNRVYKTVLLGIPRKNGKSTLAAAVALYLAIADGEVGPEVILAAASSDQASIVFDQARAYVDESVELTEELDAQRYIIRLRHGSGFVKRVSADGKLQHGLNPSGIVADELHSWTTAKHSELWSALTTGDGAREDPFTLIITTAGFDLGSILGQLYLAALTDGEARGIIERRPGLTIVRDRESGFLLWWYGLDAEKDDCDDPEVVKTANPASWITKKDLGRKAKSPTISRADYLRLHCNAWTASEEVWLPSWPALRPKGHVVGKALIPKGAEVVIGVDIGLTNDTTGIAIAHFDEEADLATVEARTFAARQDVIAHEYMQGGKLDFDLIEDYIRELGRDYAVRYVAHDPTAFGRSAQTLSDEGFMVVECAPSTSTMSAAWQTWHDFVVNVRVQHTGDPILAAHVAAAKARMTERGWKVSKITPRRKIDGMVACAIANYFASQREARNPYEEHGIRTL